MTANVITLLEQIKELDIFESHPLYFVGGTALAYYLEHRISEDIDIISATPLPHREITNTIMALGGTKLKDANAMALRLAGLFPDEYMLKFNLHGIKLEFFTASTPLQKEIIKTASPQPYQKGKLQIMDLPSIAKLKLIALLNRKKSRDLFDFKTMLEKDTLTKEQILDTALKSVKKIDSFLSFYDFIEKMQVAKDDEIVYLDEKDPKPLNWDEIHKEVLSLLASKMQCD
ncbi:MAG: nucleotidyl transferase AbiEii/AbiGii toxin family protein [Sulfurovum sp.]|nr:nucleotidyl transferase AbiEii/AbiGii toxin family protein [Sulfurovum sp.]